MIMEPAGISPPSGSEFRESRIPSMVRLQQRLRKLRSLRKEQLGPEWKHLTELLARRAATVPEVSPATPQPFVMLAQLAEQAEELRIQLTQEEALTAQLRTERDRLEASVLEGIEDREWTGHRLDECLQEIQSLQSERDRLLLSQSQLASELQAIQSQETSSEELDSLKQVIKSQNDQIGFLTSELEELKKALHDAKDGPNDVVHELRTQLLDSRKETVELRMQNSALADQVARSQVGHAKGSSEALSWEERKKLLLRELECDSEGPESHGKLEMKSIIEKTEHEIARRDSEISELRRLLAEQSSARDGLAVGAAAIAELLETDELVRSERLKLKELQEEWGDKVRQAEIELSRERAKLARERLELENLTKSLPKPVSNPSADCAGKKGNWLSRLGLKDENS